MNSVRVFANIFVKMPRERVYGIGGNEKGLSRSILPLEM